MTLDKVAELDAGGSRLAVHGPLVAVGSDEDVTLWRDLHREATFDSPGAIDRLRFDAGGKEVLAAPYALDLGGKAWTALAKLGPALIHGLDGPPSGELLVRRAEWSADGQELLVYVEHRQPRGVARGGAGAGPQARLLWMDRARHVLAVPWTGQSFALTSVALGQRWAAAAGTQVLVWDRKTRKQVATLEGHTLVVRELAFSVDEQRLASVGNDHKVVIVDTATWKQVASWDAHDGDAVAVAFHPTRPLLATTGQDGQVRLWSLAGQRLADAALGRPGTAVAFSEDGTRLLAVTDDRVVVFAVKAE